MYIKIQNSPDVQSACPSALSSSYLCSWHVYRSLVHRVMQWRLSWYSHVHHVVHQIADLRLSILVCALRISHSQFVPGPVEMWYTSDSILSSMLLVAFTCSRDNSWGKGVRVPGSTSFVFVQRAHVTFDPVCDVTLIKLTLLLIVRILCTVVCTICGDRGFTHSVSLLGEPGVDWNGHR